MTTRKWGYPDGLNHFSEIAYFLYGCAKTQVMAFQGEKRFIEAFSNKRFLQTSIRFTAVCDLLVHLEIGRKFLRGSAHNSVSCMYAYPT